MTCSTTSWFRRLITRRAEIPPAIEVAQPQDGAPPSGLPHHDLPAFSRGPSGDILGKLDDTFKVRMSFDVVYRLKVKAATRGMGASEYVRTLIHKDLFGAEHVENLARDRARAVGTNGPLDGGGGQA